MLTFFNVHKKLGKQVISALLASIILLGMLPAASFAAAPASVPSQITFSMGSTNVSGKVALGFNWVTDTSVTSSEIVYGTSADLSGAQTAIAAKATPSATDILPTTKQVNFKTINSFQVNLTDLTPNTRYYYKVGNTADGYSAVSSFVSPAMPDDNSPFSFIISADTQGTSVSNFQNTADLYNYLAQNESDSTFLVHTGDIVEDASFSDQWQYFFDAAQNLLNVMPMMTTPGNHDGASSYDQNLVQYNARYNYTSLQRPTGLSAAVQNTVYAFTYGDAQFICINAYASGNDNAIQWDFLADVCASTDKAWKIVYYHNATYDPGNSHYQLDNSTGKKLTDAGVDLVLNGHEHAYARTTLKTTSAASGTGSIQSAKPGEAPTYVIGGSVYNYAYSLDSRDTSWCDVFYDLRINATGTGGGSIYSPGVYGKVEISGNSLVYSAYYKATGTSNPFRVIDTFSISKQGDSITQPTGGGTAPTGATFLFDSFNQETGKYIARFNWTTTTSINDSALFYAKKSDFEANGGEFTNYVLGTSSTVDLRSAVAAANYASVGTAYSVDPRISHKAETAVLEPGVEYVYCVGDGRANTTGVSDPASFKAPAQDVDEFSFIFFSDAQQNSTSGAAAVESQYKNALNKALTQAVFETPGAAFILSGGDQVNYGFDTWEWDGFFNANKEIFSKYPFYLTAGNHEYDGAGNGWAPNSSWDPVDPTLRNLLGRYNPPQNGAAYYGGGDGTQRMTSGMNKMMYEAGNYYFVYGDTLFLVLDYKDQMTEAQSNLQQAWMKSVIKQNPTKWRVAVFHKSLFGYRMSSPTASWTQACDAAGIDLVLMGHDHIYVRTLLYTNSANITPQTYGDGTTYVTVYSANTDRRGTQTRKNTTDMAYVDVREVGPGYATVTINTDEIRITSKGYDTSGTLVTGDDDALVTDTPRTYDLSAWQYPSVPAETNDLSITAVSVSGMAKEGQTLSTTLTPTSATATYVWQRSSDGSAWSAITGATSARYMLTAEDVGMYIRVIATGSGFYNGTITSTATAKVTALAGGNISAVKISTSEQLAALSAGLGTDQYPVDGKYELTADIDMDGVAFSAIGGGTTVTPFMGTFDGKGYTIRNLTITSTNNCVGFFAYVTTGGHVANVVLENISYSGKSAMGGIAGACTGTIENCSVTGIISGGGTLGGLVGVLHGGTVRNNFVNTTITATSSGNGGLIGGTNYSNSGSPISVRELAIGNVILNNIVLGSVCGTTYTGASVGDMGGSSGCPLQTFNGNVFWNSATATDASNKVDGYWSSSRPIIDANQVNYYVSTLSASGIPSGTPRTAFVSKTADELAKKATYTALGWDFNEYWDWDDTASLPVPKVLNLGGDGEDTYTTIIASVEGSGGTISPSGYVLVEQGNSQTFTFIPNSYYEVDKVLVDGEENAAAAVAGFYVFENVTSVHTITVSFKLSSSTSGTAPSLVSTSAYYNLAVEKHIWITVDFGEGALGIAPANYRSAVSSIRAYRGDELVLDMAGCYWFPSTGHGQPEDLLEICYDDLQGLPNYSLLTPGTYDLKITFRDIGSTIHTIPLTVVDIDVVPVEALIAKIATLPSPVALSDKAAVVEARTDYNALTAEQKALVTNYSVLTAAESRIAALEAPAPSETSSSTTTTTKPSEATVGSSVTTTAKVANGTASAVVTEKGVTSAIENAKGNHVTLVVESPTTAKTVELTIPSASVGALSSAGGGVTVSTPLADITLDTAALSTISGAANGDVKILACLADVSALNVPASVVAQIGDRPVLDFAITSGSTTISDLGDGTAKVSVPYTLQSGEDPNAIVVYHLNNSGVLTMVNGVYDASIRTVKMVLSHFSKYVIGYNKIGFNDVTSGAWYTDAATFVSARNLFSGVSENVFAPQTSMTRAMFATVIARLAGVDLSTYTVSSFTDVSIGAWYGPAVTWASANGIVSGVGNGNFDPDASITREQMAVMTSNYLKYKSMALTSTGSSTAFSDHSQINSWAQGAVSEMKKYGILSGVGNNQFNPKGTATRAEVAQIFANLVSAMVK